MGIGKLQLFSAPTPRQFLSIKFYWHLATLTVIALKLSTDATKAIWLAKLKTFVL